MKISRREILGGMGLLAASPALAQRDRSCFTLGLAPNSGPPGFGSVPSAPSCSPANGVTPCTPGGGGGGGYQIIFMDDGGHFYYTVDTAFLFWEYAINQGAQDTDTWPDFQMALNNNDYTSILALRDPNSGPASYFLGRSVIDIPTAALNSLAPWTADGSSTRSDSCGMTATGEDMIFNITSPSDTPIKSTNTGSSFTAMSALAGSIYYGPAFDQGGNIIYIQKRLGQTYKSINSGVSFSLLAGSPTQPIAASRRAIVSICCSQNGSVVAVATCNSEGDSPNTGVIGVSPDGGTTWNNFDVKSAFGHTMDYIWCAMDALGDQILLTAGYDSSLSEMAAGWVSTDHGVSWTAQTFPTASGRAIERCGVSPDGIAMVVAYRNYSGGIFQDIWKMDYSLNSGGSWTTSSFAVQGTVGSANFEPAGVYIVPASFPTFRIIPRGTNEFSGANSTTITINTEPGVIILAIHTETPSAVSTVTSVTASGVTFARRAAKQFLNELPGFDSNYEIWWAAINTSTSLVITVNLSATVDDGTIISSLILGGNVSTPFDANVSLPAITTGTGVSPTNPTVTGISTTSVTGLVLLFGATASGNVTFGVTGGFNEIENVQNSGGTNYSVQDAQWRQFVAPLSGVTVALGGTWGLPFIAIADAIIPA